MKGCVLNKETLEVLYKFDTQTAPSLQDNEVIYNRDDIDQIVVKSTYNPSTNTFEKPLSFTQEYKRIITCKNVLTGETTTFEVLDEHIQEV